MAEGQRSAADASWWYLLQIHLPAATQRFGRPADEPALVDFTAPASRREPIEGQAYDQMPTERVGTTPAWKVEEPVHFGTEHGPARIVHPRHLPCRTAHTAGRSEPALPPRWRVTRGRCATRMAVTVRSGTRVLLVTWGRGAAEGIIVTPATQAPAGPAASGQVCCG
ncbi:hypothetical protein SAMN05216259_1019 [Actinacidiphila guanduensis]|uniref:Uncharacterized protein n=1 Tax=Actinacidiphila guanduensis TaxID=310781 RepID=A0A1G9UV59_9ACTN|nr:hypothetical protein SAMN05216259_1019 [Actinacidiphila guanduensis]